MTWGSISLPLNMKAVVRAITFSRGADDRLLMMLSVMPSVRYSVSACGVEFVKGRTAIEVIEGAFAPRQYHVPAARTTAATAPDSSHGRFPERRVAPIDLSRAINTCAVCQRAAGSISKQRLTIRTSSGGTPARNSVIGRGGEDRIDTASSPGVSPLNGLRRVIISY